MNINQLNKSLKQHKLYMHAVMMDKYLTKVISDIDDWCLFTIKDVPRANDAGNLETTIDDIADNYCGVSAEVLHCIIPYMQTPASKRKPPVKKYVVPISYDFDDDPGYRYYTKDRHGNFVAKFFSLKYGNESSPSSLTDREVTKLKSQLIAKGKSSMAKIVDIAKKRVQ